MAQFRSRHHRISSGSGRSLTRGESEPHTERRHHSFGGKAPAEQKVVQAIHCFCVMRIAGYYGIVYKHAFSIKHGVGVYAHYAFIDTHMFFLWSE